MNLTARDLLRSDVDLRSRNQSRSEKEGNIDECVGYENIDSGRRHPFIVSKSTCEQGVASHSIIRLQPSQQAERRTPCSFWTALNDAPRGFSKAEP